VNDPDRQAGPPGVTEGTRPQGARPRMAAGCHAVLDALPETYWRYVARHELFRRLWERHRTHQPRYRVIDVGCGSGGLLAYLAARAPIAPVGLDVVPDALVYGRRRGLRALAAADALELPLRSESADLVIAQDVAEHVADDGQLLSELVRVCRPSGLALIVVPAHGALWSTRDTRLGHYRRYTLSQLAERVQRAGFVVLRRTYLDLFLLPLLAAAVAAAPRTADGVPDLPYEAPGGAGLVNRCLVTLSRAESALALRARIPFGVAALVLAIRPRPGPSAGRPGSRAEKAVDRRGHPE
jgi:SAM-dependent methyltransferase